MEYFSEREYGPQPQDEEIISPNAWCGIVAKINSLISSGAFAAKYPTICEDGNGITVTNVNSFVDAAKAELPGLDWPLKTKDNWEDSFLGESISFVPDTLLILDLVEFCYRVVAKPIQDTYHSYFKHYHLKFDVKTGQEEFRQDINRILRRNNLAYELIS